MADARAALLAGLHAASERRAAAARRYWDFNEQHFLPHTQRMYAMHDQGLGTDEDWVEVTDTLRDLLRQSDEHRADLIAALSDESLAHERMVG